MNRVSQKGEIAATSKPLEKACYRCGGTGHTIASFGMPPAEGAEEGTHSQSMQEWQSSRGK